VYLDKLGQTWMTRGGESNRWDKQAFFETGTADIVHVLHNTCHLPFPLRRGRALDFGCGLGRLTQAMARYFDEVDGVDIAPAMIRQAQGFNPYGERVRFHVNRRDDLSQFADNQYDFVLSLLVLQHMRPAYAKKYVAELLRVLAPGGLLLFQQPTHYSRTPIHEAVQPSPHPVWGRAERLLHKVYNRISPPPPLPHAPGFNYSSITFPQHDYRPPLVDWQSGAIRIDDNHLPPHRTPIAETHTIKRWKVVFHLRRLGARVVGIEPRNECTPNYPSLRYYVTK
jgi:SAM-dependent methyltransferase